MDKNTKHLGKYQKHMLEFAKKYCNNGRIHSVATDSFTQKVAKSLEKRGLIIINEFNQFTLKESTHEKI